MTVDWNYEWFKRFSPCVCSSARVSLQALELFIKTGSAPPVVSFPALPMWFIFLSWVQYCTSTDICLLKRIIQLIISLSAVLPQKLRNGQIPRESVFISDVGFTAPKETILNNTADAARSIWDQRNGADEQKPFYVQYGPHQVSLFSDSQMHFCHACTAYSFVFSVDFNFYKDSSHHVMSIKAYGK